MNRSVYVRHNWTFIHFKSLYNTFYRSTELLLNSLGPVRLCNQCPKILEKIIGD